MKNYIKIISIASFFLVSAFYLSPAFAAGCTSNEECTTGNCVAGQCYDGSIGSPCLSSSVCATKNCYAGRCCPETYPMGGTCPKKTTAKVIPAVNSVENTIPDKTPILDDSPKDEDTKDSETKDIRLGFGSLTGQVKYLLPGKNPEDENSWKLVNLNDTYLPSGTHIRTQKDSSVDIYFVDTSLRYPFTGEVSLKPESEVVLTVPLGGKVGQLKMVAGNVWINKTEIQDESLEIIMDNAVIEISGTTFSLEEKNGKSTLKVIEGSVKFTSKYDNLKQTINTGEQISATAIATSPIEKFDVGAENEKWGTVKETTSLEPSAGYTTKAIVVAVIVLVGLLMLFKLKKKN